MHQSRKIRATSSTPRMLLVLACYIECFHYSYLLHTTTFRSCPSSSFHPHLPTTFPLLTYDSMMLLTSDFFPIFGTSLLSMHPSWVFPYHPIIGFVEAPKSSRVLEMGNVSGAGRKAPGLKWCCGGGRRMMSRWLGVKMYKLRFFFIPQS